VGGDSSQGRAGNQHERRRQIARATLILKTVDALLEPTSVSRPREAETKRKKERRKRNSRRSILSSSSSAASITPQKTHQKKGDKAAGVEKAGRGHCRKKRHKGVPAKCQQDPIDVTDLYLKLHVTIYRDRMILPFFARRKQSNHLKKNSQKRERPGLQFCFKC